MTNSDLRNRLLAFADRCAAWTALTIQAGTTSGGVAPTVQDEIDYLTQQQALALAVARSFTTGELPGPADPALLDSFRMLVEDTNNFIAVHGLNLAGFNEDSTQLARILSATPGFGEALNKLVAQVGAVLTFVIAAVVVIIAVILVLRVTAAVRATA
jgi:hypothetical protein